MKNFVVSEILRKKRDGGVLDRDEILHLVGGFAHGTIPDYQASAWLMATYLRGMTTAETVTLTEAMRQSGRTLDWRKMSSNLRNAVFADKHSTGGVGDKVSLILAPLAAGLGLKIPMMSGRGLGHTGGTADKLSSISGFDIFPSERKMIECLESHGICMMAQSPDLCPADRKLYSLRDVTATIESVPLITASIVSKKWAEGVDAIVFDVKCGSAAFMDTLAKAQELSHSLVRVAQGAGLRALASITRMDEPLGTCIGNALEVRESLWILENSYPTENQTRLATPLRNLCVDLAAQMAVLAGTRKDLDATRRECLDLLENGRARTIFESMVRAQGAIDGWQDHLAKTENVYVLRAPRSGTLVRIASRVFGVVGLKCGVGRQRTEDVIDPATGFEICVGVGDTVTKGQALLIMHLRSEALAETLSSELESAFDIREDVPARAPQPLTLETITS